MAAALPREAPLPPPLIGKAGRYTVFITPPRAPKPSDAPSVSPRTASPVKFEKPSTKSSGSVFGFLWDAIAKVQDAHSSLDEYLADWFGLNQSKYQWALNDYYENNGKVGDIFRSFGCKFLSFLVHSSAWIRL
ncbi:hypothetical protein B296_00001766 [Ensete ventricosum]|uniref:Uncharacterized protein n=1 Tax=Ensete ventricosum TaxID=4639 RepID=A0A427B5A5_ENSVE|nr:hypothetical protein B296_00001766 [Ensete ventricosum]